MPNRAEQKHFSSSLFGVSSSLFGVSSSLFGIFGLIFVPIWRIFVPIWRFSNWNNACFFLIFQQLAENLIVEHSNFPVSFFKDSLKKRGFPYKENPFYLAKIFPKKFLPSRKPKNGFSKKEKKTKILPGKTIDLLVYPLNYIEKTNDKNILDGIRTFAYSNNYKTRNSITGYVYRYMEKHKAEKLRKIPQNVDT